MSDLQSSYTAASTLPVKLIKRGAACVNEIGRAIRPVHVQFCPTNTCNLKCSFCSCDDRERGQEIPIEEAVRAFDTFMDLGTQAITITGGGEPCCYSDLSLLFSAAQQRKMSVGLVSNGLLLDKHAQSLALCDWCRVSVSDFRDVDKLLNKLSFVVPIAPIDWAFSYVVTKDFKPDKLADVIHFANTYHFTHVRVVSDLMDLDNTPDMSGVRWELKERDVPLDKVIFQGRKRYARGDPDCRVSLLKPVVAPDGWLYPCCGVQYARTGDTGTFPTSMRMCRVEEMKMYYSYQHVFDGSSCSVCYYQEYNDTLNALVGDFDHEEFV